MKINDIKKRIFVLGFLDLLFLILPGILAIFIYEKELFISLDWIKLTLLSASLITPFVLLNTIIMTVFDSKYKKEDSFLFTSLSLSIIITGLTVYMFITIDYFFLSNAKIAFYVFSVLEFIIFIVASFVDLYREKNSKK